MDTLIYRHDAFVEYHSPAKEAPAVIESIRFATTGCYGACPVFKLRIHRTGQATYIAGAYTKKSGTFKGTVRQETLKELFELLEYLELKKLKNEYAVAWTDDQAATLTVTFRDGKQKAFTITACTAPGVL